MTGLETIGIPDGAGLYLFHFEPRYRHACHYLGYADSIGRRIAEHLASRANASPLVRAALAAGCSVQLARCFPGETRTTERRLKRQGGLSRHCPVCRATGRYHR